jgi:hypothetical protein
LSEPDFGAEGALAQARAVPCRDERGGDPVKLIR